MHGIGSHTQPRERGQCDVHSWSLRLSLQAGQKVKRENYKAADPFMNRSAPEKWSPLRLLAPFGHGARKACTQRETLTVAGFALDGTKWDGLYVGWRKGPGSRLPGKVRHRSSSGFERTLSGRVDARRRQRGR
jgi:hypothetical protein